MPSTTSAFSVARHHLAGAALLIVAVMAACERDPITAPHTSPDDSAPLANLDAGPALPPPVGSEVPNGITASIVSTDTRNGSIPWQKIGEVDRWIVGRMSIKQTVSQNGPDRGLLIAGPHGRFVPGFYDNTCILKAVMGYRDPGGGGWTEDWRAGGSNCPWDNSGLPNPDFNYHLTWLRAGYSLWGGRVGGSYIFCDYPCHTFDGATNFYFTPTSNVLQVIAVPNHVEYGTKVTFTASRSDNVPVPQVQKWVWRPQDPKRQALTTACQHTNTTCETPVYETGWMFALVDIGYLHTAYAGVTVMPPELTVTASNTTPKVGENVTYVAATIPDSVPDFDVTGWKFVPDDASAEPATPECDDTTCVVPAQVPGTMYVFATLDQRTDTAQVHIEPRNDFKLTADKLSVLPGEVVTFTPILNGEVVPAERWLWRPASEDPTDVTTCEDNTQPCQKTMIASGTMWAYVNSLVPGQLDSADAPIDVAIVCPDGLLGSTTPAASACQDGGDPTGTYKQLRITTHGGVTGTPLPSGETLVIAYKTGKSASYRYSAAARHIDLTVVVDDMARSETTPTIEGTLVMDRDHKIEVAADFDYGNDPEVLALRARLHDLIRAGDKVDAFARHLEWFANFRLTAVRDPDSLAFKLSVARYYEFDYVKHAALLQAFDDALLGHAFMFSSAPGPKTVSIHEPRTITDAAAGNANLMLASPRVGTRAAPPIGTLSVKESLPLALLVFVNGIFTHWESAEEMAVALEELARTEPGLDGLPVVFFHNRNVWAQIKAHTGPTGCAARFTGAIDFKKRLTNAVQYLRCHGKSLSILVFQNDIVESVEQFINVVLEQRNTPPEDVPMLSQFIADYQATGLHTIFVNHSQGNLIFSQALRTPPPVPAAKKLKNVCTAAVSLASPIGRHEFMPDTAKFLTGMTIGSRLREDATWSDQPADDILLRISNTNYGIHKFERRTSAVREAALARMEGMPADVKKWYGIFASFQVHSVGPNYLRDANNGTEVRQMMVSLYNTCEFEKNK